MKTPRDFGEFSLADVALHDMRKMLINEQSLSVTRRNIRNARRFVFDDNATRLAASIAWENPDLLVAGFDWMQRPHECVWVEFPMSQVDVVVRGETRSDTEHDRVGMLFVPVTTQPEVMWIMSMFYGDWHECYMMPVIHILSFRNQEIAIDMKKESHTWLTQAMWGAAWRKMSAMGHAECYRRIVPVVIANEYGPHDFRRMIDEFAGCARNGLAGLLLLNQGANIAAEYTATGAGRKMTTKGRVRPYMSKSIVTIRVPKGRVVAHLGRAVTPQGPRRRHEVRGAWCHSQSTSRTCDHHWQSITPTVWECSRCGGRRWWREHHERGDASLGFVKKDYNVEGTKDFC